MNRRATRSLLQRPRVSLIIRMQTKPKCQCISEWWWLQSHIISRIMLCFTSWMTWFLFYCPSFSREMKVYLFSEHFFYVFVCNYPHYWHRVVQETLYPITISHTCPLFPQWPGQLRLLQPPKVINIKSHVLYISTAFAHVPIIMAEYLNLQTWCSWTCQCFTVGLPCCMYWTMIRLSSSDICFQTHLTCQSICLDILLPLTCERLH